MKCIVLYYLIFLMVVVNYCKGSHFSSNYLSSLPTSSFGEQLLVPSQFITTDSRARSFTTPLRQIGGGFSSNHQLLGKSNNNYFNKKSEIPILRQNIEQNLDGSYFYRYQTANGISSEERRAQNEAVGSYSYTGPDGVRYTVIYRAGKNGFQPIGAHLPVLPRISDAIVKSQNSAEEAVGIYDDGSYRPEKYNNKLYNRYHSHTDYLSDYNY